MGGYVEYVAAVIVASLVAAGVAGWLWRSHFSRLSQLFAGILALHTVIGVLVLGQLVSPTAGIRGIFFHLTYAVSAPVTGLWFVAALAFANRDDLLSRRILGGLTAFYGLLVGLVLTNPLHSFVWTSFEEASQPFAYVVGVPGPATMLFFVGSFLVMAGILVLGNRMLTSSGVSKWQAGVVFVGFLVPALVPWFYFVLLPPGPFNGYLVMGASMTALLVAWGAFRHQLFDLTPVAWMTVVDEIEEGVIVVDDERRVLDVNRAAVELLPALDGGVGTPIDDLVPQMIAEDGTCAEQFVLATDHGHREVTVDRSDIRSGGGVGGHALIVRDVTERERQLRSLEQQTAQLEQFASTLSHDIRNPLNVAQGNLQLARDAGEEESFDVAEDALGRIERMIDDLLALSREGRAIDEPKPVTLRAVVTDAWRMTDTAKATLEIDDEADVTILADEARLHNVFENLFRNAVEHAGPDVEIRVGRLEEGFFVEDDGPGIPLPEREHVFEYAYTTADEGTGLGLAIVEAITNAHGWDVRVGESPSGGARFEVDGATIITGKTADHSRTNGDPQPAS